MDCCNDSDNHDKMYSCENNKYYYCCKECGSFIDWIDEYV